MIFALSPLASHAVVWSLCAIPVFGAWLMYRREQVRSLDLHDGTEPDVAELFALFRDLDDE